MSSNINITDNYSWTNEHSNVKKHVLHRYQVYNNPSTGWKGGLSGIQTMIGQARLKNERLRSYGGKWSLSDVAICNDSIHDSKPLTFWGSIGENSISGEPIFKSDPKPLSERLFFFQSGSQINQINNVLEEKGFCLPTTGASNGQTIAGAVSTGTHGSALKVGAMQDYVRAIHIVTSETDHFIIQPSSNPIINKNFSDVFEAKLITDDNLFYSAVVSFGSFGIIHGLIVEAVSLYSLEAYCVRVDYNKAEGAYQYLSEFNHFSSKNLTGFLKEFGIKKKEDPYHFEIIANPFDDTRNAFIRVMYKCIYDKNKCSPLPDGSTTRVGDDILSLIGSVSSAAGGFVPVIINSLFGSVAQEQSCYIQTARNIFGDSTIYRPKDGNTSTELGVPILMASSAVKLILSLARQSNFTGLLGIRFVKNSKATLAFTKFSPLTCTIELPGLNSVNTQSFFMQVYKEMDNAKIPFTLHWGQEGDYSVKRLNLMYGDAVKQWVDDRSRLLPDPMQRYMFSNDFLKRCGLSEAPPLSGGDVIA